MALSGKVNTSNELVVSAVAITGSAGAASPLGNLVGGAVTASNELRVVFV